MCWSVDLLHFMFCAFFCPFFFWLGGVGIMAGVQVIHGVSYLFRRYSLFPETDGKLVFRMKLIQMCVFLKYSCICCYSMDSRHCLNGINILAGGHPFVVICATLGGG
uniref:Uncharacterized protein n=1 Tax=Opuntia streptacantha TaxID=393608 RepID=A0A7C8Z0N4_OPUST